VKEKQYHFSFSFQVEFFMVEVTNKFEYTRFLVAVTEVSLDMVLRRLILIYKLFLIHAVEEYLYLYNKTKNVLVQNILVFNNMRLNSFYTFAFVGFVTEV
jgi:hypothetical protein